MKPSFYLFTIFGLALFNGCSRSFAPVGSVNDSYRITLTQVHSNETERAYALQIEAMFSFDADITSGSNFSSAGRSVAASNGTHAMKHMRFQASRTSSNGSNWHRDHTEIHTGMGSEKSSVSVKLDWPIEQTLSMTVTSGTYRIGAPLLLGLHEGADLKLHITALQD